MALEEIYSELEMLITLLKSNGNDKLVRILEHRMYKVSWTSSSELLENIMFILNDYVSSSIDILNNEAIAVEKAKLIIKEIEKI